MIEKVRKIINSTWYSSFWNISGPFKVACVVIVNSADCVVIAVVEHCLIVE